MPFLRKRAKDPAVEDLEARVRELEQKLRGAEWHIGIQRTQHERLLAYLRAQDNTTGPDAHDDPYCVHLCRMYRILTIHPETGMPDLI